METTGVLSGSRPSSRRASDVAAEPRLGRSSRATARTTISLVALISNLPSPGSTAERSAYFRRNCGLRRSEPDRNPADDVVSVDVGLEMQAVAVRQLEVRKPGVAVLREQREMTEQLERDAAACEAAEDEGELVPVDADRPRGAEADVGLQPPFGHFVTREQ